MADADKQKEMDAKKAEVEDLFFIIAIMITIAIVVVIINSIMIMIMITIINAIMVVIMKAIDRCERGWRLRLQGRRTRRVS